MMWSAAQNKWNLALLLCPDNCQSKNKFYLLEAAYILMAQGHALFRLYNDNTNFIVKCLCIARQNKLVAYDLSAHTMHFII